MRYLRSYLVLLTVLLSACKEKEPEGPPPPPPPTPQEIAAKLATEWQLNAPLPPPGIQIAPQAARQYIGTIRSGVTEHSATPEGKEALRIVSRQLDQRLRSMENNELWGPALLLCDAHAVLNPGSHRFDLTRERAVVELKKPQVTVDGFYEDIASGQTAAFLSYYLPLEGATHKEKVRLGEEMYGLKFVEIIGKNQGITFEYVATGDTFDVFRQSVQN